MFVLKIGGNEIDDPQFVTQLGQAIAQLEQPPLVVHGGGKEIRALQERLGLSVQYIDGLRVTDAQSLDLVQMVLIGRINKRLVAALSEAHVDALGMSGVDRASIKAEKLHHPNGDLGYVGQVKQVRSEVFTHLLDEGVVPVLSPLCYGPSGRIFNVNADHVAMAVAVALRASQLTFISNVPGILHNDRLLDHLTPADIERLIADEVIVGGMIPKVTAALKAVSEGVAAVRITNLHGLSTGSGTVIAQIGS